MDFDEFAADFVTVTATDLVVCVVDDIGFVDAFDGWFIVFVTVDVTVVLTELEPFCMTVRA